MTEEEQKEAKDDLAFAKLKRILLSPEELVGVGSAYQWSKAFSDLLSGKNVMMVYEEQDGGAVAVAFVTVWHRDEIRKQSYCPFQEVKIEDGFDYMEFHFKPDGSLLLATSCLTENPE